MAALGGSALSQWERAEGAGAERGRCRVQGALPAGSGNAEPMGDSVPIHSWPCSYYLESSKRWIPGKLSLTPSAVQFRDKSGQLLLHSRLSGIDAIKKESSSFLFSSVTILEKEAKHWFGSLVPNRNVVFNVLEHFWREQLLSDGGAGAGAAPERSKGKELVGMLSGSQKSLEDTAQELRFQGEQFDSILRGLHRIEGDMDVADRLLTELESPSWWPFSGKLWKSPPETKPKETSPSSPAPEKREEILLRIPALVGRGTDPDAEPGTLTLLPSGLEIRDCRSRLVHRFRSRDVDDIRVHNPYELSVRQRFLGKPDRSFRLLSAGMPRLLPALEARFPGKVEFPEEAAAGKEPPGDSGAWGRKEVPDFPAGSREGLDKEQEQLQEHERISQEEAKELRQILRQLRALALEAEAELERQDEALDSVGDSVDRATLRVRGRTRRLRRLT